MAEGQEGTGEGGAGVGTTETQALPRVSEEMPVRVCPKCSTQERTAGQFCPHCGASYTKSRPRFSRRAKLVAGGLVLILTLAGAATGIVLKVHQDNQVAAQKRAAAAAAQAQQQQAQQQQATQNAQNQATQSAHQDLVNALQKSVTQDAQKDVDNGTLNGPAITTSNCTPSDGSSVTDPSVHTASFTCIAVNQTSGDGTQQGYRFSGTVNYDSGQYSWHLGG